MRQLAAAGAAIAAGAASADGCGEGLLNPPARRSVSGEGVTIAFAPHPAPVPVGRHFTLDLVVCPAPPAAPAVDAEMPAHRHGMNYRARVERVGPVDQGRYRATGMMFHMPGRWRYLFDVVSGGQRQRLAYDVDVE
jgi:hypothetical protein